MRDSRDPFLHVGLVRQVLAEGAAFQRAIAGQLQRQLALADGAHAVVHAARAEPRLRHREALAPARPAGCGGTRTSRSRISQCPSGATCCMIGMLRTSCTPGVSIGTSTMLWPSWRASPSRVALVAAHHDQQPAVGMRGAGDEPLAAVDAPAVAVLAPHRGLQIGRVRRSDIGLGHREGRADLALQQRHQPVAALRRSRNALQQVHVAAVGRAAVEDFGRPGQPAHRFAPAARSRGCPGACPARRRAGRQAQIPQPLGSAPVP